MVKGPSGPEASEPGTSRAMSCVTAWSPSMLRRPSRAAYSAALSSRLSRSRRTLKPSSVPTPPPAPGNVTSGTPASSSASRSRAIVRFDTSNRSASAPMVVRFVSASTHMIPMSRSIRMVDRPLVSAPVRVLCASAVAPQSAPSLPLPHVRMFHVKHLFLPYSSCVPSMLLILGSAPCRAIVGDDAEFERFRSKRSGLVILNAPGFAFSRRRTRADRRFPRWGGVAGYL